MNCSACYLSDMLYVVGGTKSNSIEKFDTSAKDAVWQLIALDETSFTARFWSSVSVLNSSQIAILGGRTRASNSNMNLSEIFVLDITTDSLSKASDGNDITVVNRNN